MQVITSYKVKVKHYNHIFDDTLKIYREALAYLIDVVNAEWESIKYLSGLKLKQGHIEHLVHSTSKREAKYDFDTRFHKYPSYLLRGTISEAIGKVSAYRSNYANWEKNERKGKPPQLQYEHFEYPALFRENMYIREDDYTAQLKIYHRNDWVWLTVKLRKSDVDYIKRNKARSTECAPTLYKDGRNWYLRFAYKDTVELTIKKEIIIGVDLGINHAATCSAMRSDGTVIGRKFIDFPVEKDQMYRKLNKIKQAQQNGARRTPRLWAFANNYNRALSEKTAQAIVAFASLHHADVIVFENLNMNKKKRGSKKQRLHLWRKKAVIKMVSCKAHLLGMRISTVCAWGTSRYAYDGSGEVVRDKDNYSMCTFKTGKRYNCDLSASYNIAARYYIRDVLKSLPETVRLGIEAKDPRFTRRITSTLATLNSLSAELMQLAV